MAETTEPRGYWARYRSRWAKVFLIFLPLMLISIFGTRGSIGLFDLLIDIPLGAAIWATLIAFIAAAFPDGKPPEKEWRA